MRVEGHDATEGNAGEVRGTGKNWETKGGTDLGTGDLFKYKGNVLYDVYRWEMLEGRANMLRA